MNQFNSIALDQLPIPDVIDQLTYEDILNEMLQEFRVRIPEYSSIVESDPAYKILEIAAYRELILRQRVNNASRAVMVASAAGTDLDNLAALFKVTRHTITPADLEAIPPINAVLESDDNLRNRIPLSLEGISTAGSIGGYVYHALSASGKVKDVSIDSPRFSYYEPIDSVKAQLPDNTITLQVDYDAYLNNPIPGDVAVTVLSLDNNGTADNDLISEVNLALNSENVRPITDTPRIRTSEIIEYSIDAELVFYPGPDRALVLQQALRNAEIYTKNHHKNGQAITLSGIYSALHIAGVYKVNLTNPVFDASETLTVLNHQAAFCTTINISDGGVHA
jgi:phage-related baseplate assembly protein